ncbi:hypothetical protein PS2015_1074 [Pseudohongiella spirulinae]|uniref:Uncharacterized protein n=1 Tax=Pseudohongiella spirulinae TaxID=1249552 RepID=A0A0S2KBR4_9GAMM|nr:hypothetical protein PS2015_1074 [Pseudohongiella spirulinae]
MLRRCRTTFKELTQLFHLIVNYSPYLDELVITLKGSRNGFI